MVDLLTIVATISGSIMVALVIWLTHSRMHQRYLEQQKRQAKLDSARLVVEIDKQYRTDEFRTVLENVHAGWHDEFEEWENHKHLIRFLNYTSMVCAFHEDNILTDKHMMWFYDETLIALDSNNWIHEHIKKTDACVALRRRLKKIKCT